MPDRSKVMTQT